MRAAASNTVTLVALFLLVGCGGGGNFMITPPPPPPPPPVVSNPNLMWTGDVQVSSGLGDHGIGTAGPSGLAIVPDSAGGAMFVWEDDATALVRIQHLDVNGNRLWQTTGIVPSDVNAYQASPQAVSDGSGGVIVSWVDGRSGFCDFGFKGDCDIYAQRIDSNGNLLWNSSGVPVVTAWSNQGSSGIAMISDGTGGAIMAWEDARSCCTIYAQRIAGSGQVLWAVDGIQVSPSPTIVIGTIGAPQMIGDGTGGAIVSWWNTQSADPNQVQTVSTQRLDPNGTIIWAAGGVSVSGLIGGPASGNALGYALTSDAGGGAIFAGVFVDLTATGIATTQRIDGTGQVMWGANAVQISSTPAHVLNPTLVADGSGGAILSWNACAMQAVDCSILIQHVDPSGRLTWAVNGIPITRTPNTKYGPIAMSDGAGGAIVAWEDCPNVSDFVQCVQGIDVYAQRVDPAGQAIWQTNGFPVSTAPENQGVQTGGISAGIYGSVDNVGNIFLGWPDGRINHQCSYLNFPSRCDLFAQRLH